MTQERYIIDNHHGIFNYCVTVKYDRYIIGNCVPIPQGWTTLRLPIHLISNLAATHLWDGVGREEVAAFLKD